MLRRGKQSKVYRTEILQMSICRDKKNETKIYRTEILQRLIWGDKERKVKYTELKYCRCE